MTIEEVIGDAAYSEKRNLDYDQANNIKLISKLNPVVSQGARKQDKEFEFNKGAGLYVCPAGVNQVSTYYFDYKNANAVIEEKGAIQKERSQKLIPYQLNLTIIKSRWLFRKRNISKSVSKSVI